MEELLQKDVETKEDSIFVTSKNVKIRCQGINPFKLEQVRDSVKIPNPPRYEIRTATGKTESFYLDEVAAQEIDHGTAMWNTYLIEKRDKMAEQNARAMRAIFVMGCRILDWGDTSGWEQENEILGVTVPTEPRERELFYLMNELPGDELKALTDKIMRFSGATEEDIKQAEDSFRG